MKRCEACEKLRDYCATCRVNLREDDDCYCRGCRLAYGKAYREKRKTLKKYAKKVASLGGEELGGNG